MLSAAFHAIAVFVVCAALVLACRSVSRFSALAGRVLLAALAIRVAGAMFFFWTSYLHLPILTSMQMGNGFWTIAPDAEEYFRLISNAASVWVYHDPEGRSVGYVATVGWWARIVGLSPASVLFFNVVLSVAITAGIAAAFGRVQDRRSEWAAVASIAAFGFSPMLILTTVQGLKDVFVVALIAAVAIASTTLLTHAVRRPELRTHLMALVVAAVGVWLMALTRNYLALLIWGAAVSGYLSGVVFAGRSRRVPYAMRGAAVLAVCGVAALAGSDRFYSGLVTETAANAARRAAYVWKSAPSRASVAVTSSVPAASPEHGAAAPVPAARAEPPLPAPVSPPAPIFKRGLEEVEEARNGFTRTGGATVLEPVDATATRDRPRAIISGLAVIFVPISILQRLSIANMARQPRFLLFADADTLFLDLTIVVISGVLFWNRRRIDWAVAVFLVALVIATALPMAYVVTNYGTLIRLRLMVAAPLWLLPLSITPALRRSSIRPQSSDQR